MNIYFASTASRPYCPIQDFKFVLESFCYIKDWQIPLIPQWDSFMLDSGAFTFISSNKGTQIHWDEYVEDYAAFINRHDIKLFFELDIDKIVGLEEVERLRAKLELLTGRQSIPVWHKSRGKEYFMMLCQQYSYIAIGGLAIQDIMPRDYKYLQWFINYAHSKKCKIHG